MTFIDDFLNRITMYRLALYILTALLGVAALLSLIGTLPYSASNLVFSTVLIFALCTATNYALAKLFRAPTNVESVYITACILALTIAPVAPTDKFGIGFIILASVSAMISKYLLVFRKKHLFNPAAFGLALPLLLFGQSATWWTDANPALLACVVLGGLLIVRKLRRFDLVLSFFAVVLLTAAVSSPNEAFLSVLRTLQYSSFYFFAFVMLTEPLTTPPGRMLRVLYGTLVGLLYASNFHIWSVYFSLETALLAGNLFAFIVSPKGRFVLELIEKKEVAAGTLELSFTSHTPLTFHPGQYLEWTLPHSPSDSRGTRRFFTIASSPTEESVRLGVRVGESGSSFKRALFSMRVGDTISTSPPSGDFTLPSDPATKLAFIAGGIGITPFRSMVQYLLDTKDIRTVTLLYSNKTASEIAYKNIFDRAQQEIGMKTVYALTAEQSSLSGTYAGKIDATLIAREIPDYRERTFYISGPHGMVTAFEKTLHDIGVSHLNIKTDYFPGFA